MYVSPLKALSNDIHKNLEEPLAGIRAALLASEGRDVDVRAAVRTGDTPAAKRQAIAQKAAAHFGHDAGIVLSAADFHFRPEDAGDRAHLDRG